MNQQTCDSCGKVITGKIYSSIDDNNVKLCVKCYSADVDDAETDDDED